VDRARREPAKKERPKHPEKSLSDNNSCADDGNASGTALYRGSGRLLKPRTRPPAAERDSSPSHWLAEQALSWSGLPVVTVRPTVFLEGFFLLLAAGSVRDTDELALPMGAGKTSPVSSVDVARAVAAILDDPAPHIGHIYDLTGPESADLDHYARVFSEVLGRTIRYRDAATSEWSEKLRAAGLSEHVVHHLTVMTELHKQGRYDRMSEDYLKLTGETPTSMADFVKLHAAEFTRPSRFGALKVEN
jgi:hypothetical protein